MNIKNIIPRVKKKIASKLKVSYLLSRSYVSTPISPIWKNNQFKLPEKFEIINQFKIFNHKINLNFLNWHTDFLSGYEYPVKRIDKLKISNVYNQGIDVKTPWEISRFYFAPGLGLNYQKSKNEEFYLKFKELVVCWIDNNPFLHGVNWICPMEAAIRSINWIISVHIFNDVFWNDVEFKRIISKSLHQHAWYIYKFPEIYKNGITNNHTISDYVGLLFLALVFENDSMYNIWLKKSLKGIVDCMNTQVYEDGVHFESSIPYHHLVIELFSYAAVLILHKKIIVNKSFFIKLFKMYEFFASYLDNKGNFPRVGDDDSGKVIDVENFQFNRISWLFSVGEYIFDYCFKCGFKERVKLVESLFPGIKRINPEELNIELRNTENSIGFEKGGGYVLKNEEFNLFLSCFPIGQNGIGGHNHYDFGSFTLSIDNNPVIIDPGAYTYTRDFRIRNKFKSFKYHNLVLPQKLEPLRKNMNIWHTPQYIKSYAVNLIENAIKLEYIYSDDLDNYKVIREINLDKSLKIRDCYPDNFVLCFFIDAIIVELDGNNIYIDRKYKMIIDNNAKISLKKEKFAPEYNVLAECYRLKIFAQNELKYTFQKI